MLTFISSLNFCLSFLTFHGCLSYIIWWRKIQSRTTWLFLLILAFQIFSIYCFLYWLPLVHLFGDLVVLEVVHKGVLWLNHFWGNNLVFKSLYQKEKEGSKKMKFILLHFKDQIIYIQTFHQTPYVQAL